MKPLLAYFILIVFVLTPLMALSQEYTYGASPIVDSLQFHKPQFVLHYNDEVITFTKVDSIIYRETPVQNINETYNKSFITKRKDSLILIMKTKKYAFIDDSTADKRQFGLVQYDGFLKKLKIHMVKVVGWTGSIFYAVHEDATMDTLWFAGIAPTESNTKLVGYQFQGNYYQVCVDSFNAAKNKFEEIWDFSFLPEKLYAFKWINENEFFTVISEHHKRKYYYKVKFATE